MADQNNKTKKSYFSESMQVMGIAFELGFIIAIPLVLLAFAGKWLDQKTGQGFFVYIGIVLALSLTSLWIYARLKSMVERLKKASKLKENQDSKAINETKEEEK